jgi:two-component system cell cycle response regulator DivK
MPRKTILIVEDNELSRRLLNDVLDARGYRVVLAATGTAAIEVARQEKLHLILLDMRLPDISGLDVARALRSLPNARHVPIIAVTAYAMRGDEQIVMAHGCDAYMSKPINIHDVLALIDMLLSRSHSGSSRRSAGILPPAGSTTRWSAQRKALVLIAIRGGMISLPEACARYSVSQEELSEWRRAFERHGIAGLSVKKISRRSRSNGS